MSETPKQFLSDKEISSISNRASTIADEYPLPLKKEFDYYECPMCQGGGEVDCVESHAKRRAFGIQVYGIGDDLNQMEEFANKSPQDIQSLLSHIAALEELMEKMAKFAKIAYADTGVVRVSVLEQSGFPQVSDNIRNIEKQSIITLDAYAEYQKARKA